MSLIRIRSPYHEPRDIEQDPSFARVSGYGSSLIVGALAVGDSAKTVSDRSRREWQERHDALRGEALLNRPRVRKRDDRPTCGKTLHYIGEPCARTPGHGWDCKSAEDLERRAADRRADRLVDERPTESERLERRRAYLQEWKRERRARERDEAGR